MSEELRNLISGTAEELNPEFNLDNLESTDEEVIDDTIEQEEEAISEEEVEDSEDDLSDDEDSDESDTNGERYTVKVDGEEFEVTLEELKSGYQRQADYTREKQALKAEIEQIEQVKEVFGEQLSALEELDAAWDENPIQVLTHFTSNTANPTQAVALLIRDLAAQNLLEPQFMEMFGITPQVQQEWARETELNQLRTANQRGTSLKDQELQSAQMELEVQRAIAEYDQQIDDIIDTEGLNFNVKQRAAFRQELAKYAADNELTNLKAAYKAFKYEESQKTKALAAKTAEKAKQKKAAGAATRSGSGQGAPVQDTSDLNAVIRAAMKEAQG
jgi:hypothetical protein